MARKPKPALASASSKPHDPPRSSSLLVRLAVVACLLAALPALGRELGWWGLRPALELLTTDAINAAILEHKRQEWNE